MNQISKIGRLYMENKNNYASNLSLSLSLQDTKQKQKIQM